MTAPVAADTRCAQAWDVLGTVLDPEVPALSVRDLGIVRDVIARDERLEVVLTPTYSGCPATEVIEHDVLAAINRAGLGPAYVTLQRGQAMASTRRPKKRIGTVPSVEAGPGGAMP